MMCVQQEIIYYVFVFVLINVLILLPRHSPMLAKLNIAVRAVLCDTNDHY